jgi:hypothetical protein
MGDTVFPFDEMAPILKNVTVFSGFDETNIRMMCDRCEDFKLCARHSNY